MANFSIANIMRLVVMILLAVALGMIVCYDRKSSYNLVYVIIAGELIVYITFVVGICTEEVDAELAQYTDILCIGPTFGLGLYWIVAHDNDFKDEAYAMIMGICAVVASIFMLISAILTK